MSAKTTGIHAVLTLLLCLIGNMQVACSSALLHQTNNLPIRPNKMATCLMCADVSNMANASCVAMRTYTLRDGGGGLLECSSVCDIPVPSSECENYCNGTFTKSTKFVLESIVLYIHLHLN